jgi:hypothetical protein
MLPRLPILELLQDSCDPSFTPKSLDGLQRQLGVRFPQQYAEFLLAYNGGYFTRSVGFSIPYPRPFVTAAALSGFIGEPDVGCEGNGLVWYRETLDDRISPDYLTIANCNASDLVVLKLVGPESRFEGVWYWDSGAIFESEDEQSMYWLADSFYEFLGMLVHEFDNDPEERETLPLFQAVERGAITAIENYLGAGGDVDARNEHGHTLLMAASIYRWPKIVRLLLAHSANPNARDATTGQTPLHYAARSSYDSVKLLLAAGADATARDHEGKSVLGQWSYRADQMLRAKGASE